MTDYTGFLQKSAEERKDTLSRVTWKHPRSVVSAPLLRIDQRKMVFGQYRDVTVLRTKKHSDYRIHDGRVQVRYRGGWHEVKEWAPEWTDFVLSIKADSAETAFGESGSVVLA